MPGIDDVVTCILTSNATCITGNPATSNAVTMSINANLPVSVSVTPSANPACAGSSVTYTATPVNGGSFPSYQWQVNGSNVGTSSTAYSYIPANNNTVKCVLTSNVTCATGSPATSNTVTMTVNTVVAAGVSIGASANPVLAGTSVTFTATPTNGGSTPSYQWKVNGVNVGTNSTTYSYTPVNNDAVTCVMTSNATCITGNPATSGTVIMTVNPSTISVSLTLFLEGLYAGNGTMNPAKDNSGAHWGASVADKINVELHSSSSYASIPYTASNVSLSTNGMVSFVVPGTYNGSYYITIKNRNSIETVSAIPVSFASGNVNYNFSDMATKAFGSNLRHAPDGSFLIYCGDINQDGYIDTVDMGILDGAVSSVSSGFIPSDLNGDSVTDSEDLLLLDNNSALFITRKLP
jgi:hypothetical protein